MLTRLKFMDDYGNERKIRKNERKYCVLKHIVSQYVSSAIPVSSKTVAEKMKGRVSSATVRYIMGELEEEGHIKQPHISSGRVPTQSGYRIYVDMVKDTVRLEKKEAERLAMEYIQRIRRMEDIIEKTSSIISRELHNVGFVMRPRMEDSYLKHIQLVKMNAEAVMAVFVTMTNMVRNYVIKLEEDIAKTELEKIANYINRNYETLSFGDILQGLKSLVEEKEKFGLAEQALKIVDFIIKGKFKDDMGWEGLDYFMREPELYDICMIGKIFQAFSESGDIIRLVRNELPYSGIKTYIGDEVECEMLRECSMITCGYTLYGKTAGRLGVVGPTRMNYERALEVLRYLSEIISSTLERINEFGE